MTDIALFNWDFVYEQYHELKRIWIISAQYSLFMRPHELLFFPADNKVRRTRRRVYLALVTGIGSVVVASIEGAPWPWLLKSQYGRYSERGCAAPDPSTIT